MAVSRLTLLIGPVVAWAVCSFCSLLACWHPAKTPLDLDEVYWVGSSYYYNLAFIQRDWTHPHWQMLPARENPPVAKYVIGAGLAIGGLQVDSLDGLGYFYYRWLGWDKRTEVRGQIDVDKRARVIDATTPGFRERLRENGRLPVTRPLVQAARNTVVVCAVLSSCLLFLLGTVSLHWVAGLAASQLLLWHPIVVTAYHHAMADIIALMFSLAAAITGFYWFRFFSSPKRRFLMPSLALSFSTGLMLALACGAKMNSLTLVLLMGALVALASVQTAIRGNRSGAVQIAAYGLGILGSGIVFFVMINPTLLQDPIRGLAATVFEHDRTGSIQTDLGNGPLLGWQNRFAAVVSMGFLGWGPFLAVCAIVGWSGIRYGQTDHIRFAVLWWLTTLMVVAWWIPFAWSRYVIPVVPPSALLIGYFVHDLIGRFALIRPST